MGMAVFTGGSNVGTTSNITSQSVTSTVRENEYTKTELTNIQTKADTWGKVIPWGFGRHRVAGALIWASDFYATTSGFDDKTQTTDIYTQTTGTDSPDFMDNPLLHKPVIILPPDQPQSTSSWTEPGASQISTTVNTSSSIDLCYSFGKEGDKRRRRYVDKIRINDTLAYDRSTGFIAPGLGFSIRYGWDTTIPDLMQNYADGIYFYKGQDLIVFDKFPTANYGDAIPESVDVEFGCCGGGDTGDTGDTGPILL